MKLKTATILVIVSLSLLLIISISMWFIISFKIVDYEDYEWLLAGVNFVQILLYTAPLIVFFLVLNSKQKGSGNE